MSSKSITFVSQNEDKYKELKPLFDENDIDVRFINDAIKEIQSDNLAEIIKEKTLVAFRRVARPVLVDHAGLFVKAWGEMPGGLTQLFWDKLLGEKICKMLSVFSDKSAVAKAALGFCDGKRLFLKSQGALEGRIADRPRGGGFQWGSIFLPKGYTKVYSELEIDERNKISHRASAFAAFLKTWKEINP